MRTRLLAALLLAVAAAPAAAQMGAGHQPRDSFSNFDRDRDGYISPREAREGNIVDRIDQMDHDGDGLVTEREFNTMEAPGIATGYVRPEIEDEVRWHPRPRIDVSD